jgi:hypothetical protein
LVQELGFVQVSPPIFFENNINNLLALRVILKGVCSKKTYRFTFFSFSPTTSQEDWLNFRESIRKKIKLPIWNSNKTLAGFSEASAHFIW